MTMTNKDVQQQSWLTIILENMQVWLKVESETFRSRRSHNRDNCFGRVYSNVVSNGWTYIFDDSGG